MWLFLHVRRIFHILWCYGTCFQVQGTTKRLTMLCIYVFFFFFFPFCLFLSFFIPLFNWYHDSCFMISNCFILECFASLFGVLYVCLVWALPISLKGHLFGIKVIDFHIILKWFCALKNLCPGFSICAIFYPLHNTMIHLVEPFENFHLSFN